ncbi:DUF2264 domain-containing protein [Photobacterium damselae]|uniref:DUF2264 domain-containing protein n=1 Tax=Photobacterium damselae TaxID=38293 RepID=UPI000DF8FF24|nr:DUF2264 domain-containing protein [Photobacterium damselae]SUB90803.1 Uncharacterized protein conserved in bacteria [Photobacterium damselae]
MTTKTPQTPTSAPKAETKSHIDSIKHITATERPIVPYEHPDAKMYWHLFKQRLVRLKVKKPRYAKHDHHIQQLFQQEHDLRVLCDSLSQYVTEAFCHYSVWDHSHAYYPGRPSQQSARTDAVEGVSRVLPTLAAWLHFSNQTQMTTLDGQLVDIASLLSQAFLAGTNPTHPGYWGTLHNCDQRICESADLALALWLSKEWVWQHYSAPEQQQIVQWFKQVNSLITVDNNWHLFPLTVQVVLKALTGEDLVDHDKYERIKVFYVGDGWFRDGAKGNYDYYNAWGFHYSLYWLDQIDPSFDPDFIRQSLSDFVAGYRYFFTPQGLPFFGRSACYRLAAAAPLLMAIDQNSSALSVGEAKRAFRLNLTYFVGNGAMQYGAPTQGLFQDDGRLVDNYSGPASSFWSLRALNIALFMGNRCDLWHAKETPLMIEQQGYDFDIPAIQANIKGVFETKEIVVTFQHEYTEQQTPLSRRLESQSYLNKALELVLGRAERPKNNLLRKGITSYSSKMSHFF